MITFLIGLIGGLIGIIQTLINMVYKQNYYLGYTWHSYGALAASVVGLYFAFLTRKRPRIAGIGMYVCGIVGLISASYSYFPAGIAFILAGSIAYFIESRRTEDADD
ncbi:hypothetical protein [Alicyclobacillus acidiphilus]|uniref:hypothetical protein n=1 Tax=Alicyclobacillus acidiphilus TaxID=182455 RepID=UPI000836C75E|nr:hypothetical protein [Alicyclobacillus acidiphilus]